jgi:class 3 adenylate cyclase
MKRLLLPLTVGVCGFALVAALMFQGGQLAAWAQMGVSDLLMVRADGPRFGARPVRSDIALVLFDQKSATELGYVHSYSNDVKLYRQLIAAGAHVVFDTRMIAAATPEAIAEIRPMLDEMLTLNNDGRLLRDVWLSTDLRLSTEGRYDNLISQNVVNSHPHTVPTLGARLYPLAYFDVTGSRESAPLVICRRAWELEPRSTKDVGAELLRSGVMSAWHTLSPLVPKTDIPRTAYMSGEHAIVWHTFQCSTSLVPPVAFWVSYDPPVAEYARHSFVEVMAAAATSNFEGKIVIVGYAAEIDPTSDTYAVPSLPGKACAAEVVAAATQTLLDGRNMEVPPRVFAIFVAAAMTIGLALITGLLKPVQASVVALSILLAYYTSAVFAYRGGWYADFLILPACSVGTGIVGGIVNAWLSLRSRQRVIDLFGRYVPRAVVNQLILRPEVESLVLCGVKREVTVLFADIRGFTSFSQDMPPEEVVTQLNALLEIMVACTFENDGTLDKFIGDAILVLFNAPLDQPDHVQRAVRTAVSIQKRLSGHASGLRVGIGVHRGEAVIGNIGTPQRMEYTAIGSTVNIASRLCDMAQPGEVVISRSVQNSLPESFSTESLGPVHVKGIDQPLEVARVNCI